MKYSMTAETPRRPLLFWLAAAGLMLLILAGGAAAAGYILWTRVFSTSRDTISASSPATDPKPVSKVATAHPPTTSSSVKPAAPVPQKSPGYNFALAANGGTATGGTRPALLIDGNSTIYDGGAGYAETTWNAKTPQSFIVELKQSSTIDCVRFLLWDLEELRFYRYKVEISAMASGRATRERDEWKVVSDRTGKNEERRSWQIIRFDAQPVKRIRVTGTYNSANSSFHIVELQACMAPPNGFPAERPAEPAPAPQPSRPGPTRPIDDNLEF
jgi:hypothetical protein